MANKKKEKKKITLDPTRPQPKDNLVQESAAKVLKSVGFQRGSSKREQDLLYQAMKPGKRLSKNGKVYYEYRKNRTDLTPRRY